MNVNVNVTPSSDTSMTVTVPSSVGNNVTAGNAVTIKFTNASGFVGDGANTTVLALPSGGTITTSGNYRIHTFTSSSNLVLTKSVACEYLVVAGGGGGGGANGAGGNGSGHYGGNGGDGHVSSINGSTVTRAGGGGGGVGAGVAASTGGSGGGGAGASRSTSDAVAGTTNTGSGGGGAADSNVASEQNGANGGSGIVIVRYNVTSL